MAPADVFQNVEKWLLPKLPHLELPEEILKAVLGFVVCGVCVWFWQRVRLMRRSQRLKDALAIFHQNVHTVDSKVLARRANRGAIDSFYRGEPIQWDIIAAHADVDRDLKGELLRLARVSSAEPRLITITGPPGEGKTTLLWRVAAELYRSHRQCVLVFQGNDSESWSRLTNFYERLSKPFYVLVDDPFRYQQTVRALRSLDRGVPVTVLATSRSSDYKSAAKKLGLAQHELELKPPSDCEKKSILSKLGKSRNELNRAQQQGLESKKCLFLVLMLELTSGKNLLDCVHDELDQLRELDSSVYRAYEYISFAGQYDLAIPESLIEKLDRDGRFHKLTNRDAAHGVILKVTGRDDLVRSRHSVIAKAVQKVYGRNPRNILTEIVNAADPSLAVERWFVTNLTSLVCRYDVKLLEATFVEIQSKMTECISKVERANEFESWAKLYEQLGKSDEAERLWNSVVGAPLASPTDCVSLINACDKLRRGKEAIGIIINEWLETHDDDLFVRELYLHLIDPFLDNDLLRKTREEYESWLNQHKEDSHIRASYSAFVGRKLPEQLESWFDSLEEWLGSRHNDSRVRTVYLSLLKNTDGVRAAQALNEHASLLASSSCQCDQNTRDAYLSLALRKGTPEQQRTAFALARHWVLGKVRVSAARKLRAFFRIRHAKADVTEIDTNVGLEKYQDQNMRGAYLSLLEKSGTQEEVNEGVDAATAWLQSDPGQSNVRIQCFDLLVRRKKDDDDELARLANDTLEYLRNRLKDEVIKKRLCYVLENQPARQWKKELAHSLTELWPTDSRVRCCYGRALSIGGDFESAEAQYLLALSGNPALAHNGLAICAWKRPSPSFNEAERHFQQSIRLLRKMPQRNPRLLADYGWFLYSLDDDREREAIPLFEEASRTTPWFALNYIGLAESWHRLQRCDNVLKALGDLKKNATRPLEPNVVKDMDRLWEDCEQHARTAAVDAGKRT